MNNRQLHDIEQREAELLADAHQRYLRLMDRIECDHKAFERRSKQNEKIFLVCSLMVVAVVAACFVLPIVLALWRVFH